MTGRPARRRRGVAARGFTLAETILVIVMLGLAAGVIMRMQPRIFSAQTAAKDELVGLEIQRACAERLLAVRRGVGYTSVQGSTGGAPTCSGLGAGNPGFAANPSVALADDAGAALAACASTSATCTASITVAKTAGPAPALPALTLRLYRD